MPAARLFSYSLRFSEDMEAEKIKQGEKKRQEGMKKQEKTGEAKPIEGKSSRRNKSKDRAHGTAQSVSC